MNKNDMHQDQPCFAGSPDREWTGEWQRVHHSTDQNGRLLVVDTKVAPFDGKPVLIATPSGLVEVRWIPEDHSKVWNGDEADGFHWLAMNSDTHDLLDIEFWMPAPDKTSIASANPPSDAKPRLILVSGDALYHKEHAPAWVEAWYDATPEFRSWCALDDTFGVSHEHVIGFLELPLLNDAIIDAVRKRDADRSEHESEIPSPEKSSLFDF